jgi:hypothetical protein
MVIRMTHPNESFTQASAAAESPEQSSFQERPVPADRPFSPAEPAGISWGHIDSLPALSTALQAGTPVTWLLTGETLLPPSSLCTVKSLGLVERASHVDALTQLIREGFGRRSDVFISNEAPAACLEFLLEQFDRQIGRFSPQIVIIQCGETELSSPLQSSLEFERTFYELIRRVRAINAVPVISTPPCLPCPQGFVRTDQLIRLEAIRGCAEEAGAFLVDQWEHWEQEFSRAWLNQNGSALTRIGAYEVAYALAAALQLEQSLSPPAHHASLAPTGTGEA